MELSTKKQEWERGVEAAAVVQLGDAAADAPGSLVQFMMIVHVGDFANECEDANEKSCFQEKRIC